MAGDGTGAWAGGLGLTPRELRLEPWPSAQATSPLETNIRDAWLSQLGWHLPGRGQDAANTAHGSASRDQEPAPSVSAAAVRNPPSGFRVRQTPAQLIFQLSLVSACPTASLSLSFPVCKIGALPLNLAILPGVARPSVKVTHSFSIPRAGLGPEPAPQQGCEGRQESGAAGDPSSVPTSCWSQQETQPHLPSSQGHVPCSQARRGQTQPEWGEGERWLTPWVPAGTCVLARVGGGAGSVHMSAGGLREHVHACLVCVCVWVCRKQKRNRAGPRLAGRPGSWRTSPVPGRGGTWGPGRGQAGGREPAQEGANDQLAVSAGGLARPRRREEAGQEAGGGGRGVRRAEGGGRPGCGGEAASGQREERPVSASWRGPEERAQVSGCWATGWQR